jgi:hypothetical protein
VWAAPRATAFRAYCLVAVPLPTLGPPAWPGPWPRNRLVTSTSRALAEFATVSSVRWQCVAVDGVVRSEMFVPTMPKLKPVELVEYVADFLGKLQVRPNVGPGCRRRVVLVSHFADQTHEPKLTNLGQSRSPGETEALTRPPGP